MINFLQSWMCRHQEDPKEDPPSVVPEPISIPRIEDLNAMLMTGDWLHEDFNELEKFVYKWSPPGDQEPTFHEDLTRLVRDLEDYLRKRNERRQR